MTERHIKWILLASLLANAVFIGFLVGNGGRGLRPIMATLTRPLDGDRRDERRVERNNADRADQPTREVLRQAFAAERPAMHKALQELAAARKQSVALIRAETVDGPALDAALAQIRLSSDEVIAAFHRAVAVSAGKLDATQRGALARLLDRAPGRRGGSPAGVPRDVLRNVGPEAPPLSDIAPPAN
jgi:uncharacterized membrane protein